MIGRAHSSRRSLAGRSAALILVASLAACQSSATSVPSGDATAGGRSPSATAQVATAGPTTAPGGGVQGNGCPMVFDASTADFYPIQPSFSAGYTATAQKLNDTTASWAYVVSGDFPYSYWMAWYLYDTKGVPLVKIADSAIVADPGSTNPFIVGEPILAPARHYHIYLMPATTPQDVLEQMRSQGKNVAVLPALGTTEGVSIVSRSYWSLSNDGLGDYDRFGYGGPTHTPPHAISAYLTDPSTGQLSATPVADCGSQSQLPQKLWYDPAKNGPVVSFADATPPADSQLADLPHLLLETGSFSGTLGSEFPPTPVAAEVQFYRNVAANSPYADVSAAPPEGDPPDACGGYVMANLPNDVVSLVRIPKVPTFPDYQGATASTLNVDDQFDLKFYSVVVYGAEKQIDAVGSVENSQLGNRQIGKDVGGGATVVVYPRSATSEQVARIKAVADANGWNILKGGTQTAKAPNLMVVREKGANANWSNSLSPNQATKGAPCPQTSDPSLPLPQDPPSAQVTQTNGMGLSAPQGANCSIDEFLSGACLKKLGGQIAAAGGVWSATLATPPAQVAP